MSEPKWIRLTTYAELYDVDPRTIHKWADAGLVELVTIRPSNGRAVIRVKNRPPLPMHVKTSQTRTS